MLLTIFKYLWILPIAFVYIAWTVMAVKAFILFLNDRKKYKDLSFWDNDYAVCYSWVIVHMILIFCASFAYFISGEIL